MPADRRFQVDTSACKFFPFSRQLGQPAPCDRGKGPPVAYLSSATLKPCRILMLATCVIRPAILTSYADSCRCDRLHHLLRAEGETHRGTSAANGRRRLPRSCSGGRSRDQSRKRDRVIQVVPSRVNGAQEHALHFVHSDTLLEGCREVTRPTDSRPRATSRSRRVSQRPDYDRALTRVCSIMPWSAFAMPPRPG